MREAIEIAQGIIVIRESEVSDNVKQLVLSDLEKHLDTTLDYVGMGHLKGIDIHEVLHQLVRRRNYAKTINY